MLSNNKKLGWTISSYNKDNNYHSCTVTLELHDTKIRLKKSTNRLSDDILISNDYNEVIKYIEVGTIFKPNIKKIDYILVDINKKYKNSNEWIFSDKKDIIMSCSSTSELINYYLNEDIKISRHFKLQKLKTI